MLLYFLRLNLAKKKSGHRFFSLIVTCFGFWCWLFSAWIPEGFFVFEVEELNHGICFDLSFITYLEPFLGLYASFSYGNFRFVKFVFYLLGCFRDSSYLYIGALLSLYVICSIIIWIPLFSSAFTVIISSLFFILVIPIVTIPVPIFSSSFIKFLYIHLFMVLSTFP